MANKTEQATLELIIKGDVANKSLRDLYNAARAVSYQMKDMLPGTDEFAKAAEISQRIKGKISEITSEISGTDAAWKKYRQNTEESETTIGKALDQIGERIKSIGETMAIYFGIEKIVEFGKSSVEAFSEAELSAKKLENAVRLIAKEGDGSYKELIEQAEQFQKTSIFSHDKIEQIQVMGIQFGLTTEKVKALVPVVVDFASATGQDVTTAMEAMLRGIEGNSKGLKVYGIDIVDSGSKSENFNQIIQAMTKFQGQAAAAMDTTAAKTKMLENAWHSIKETIGSALIAFGGTFIQGIRQLYDEYLFVFNNALYHQIELTYEHEKTLDGIRQAQVTHEKVFLEQVTDMTLGELEKRHLESQKLIAQYRQEGNTARLAGEKNVSEELEAQIKNEESKHLADLIQRREGARRLIKQYDIAGNFEAADLQRENLKVIITEIQKKEDTTSDLTKKGMEEKLAAQKKFNEDTKKLQKQLEDATVESIDDEFLRETAKLKLKHDQDRRAVVETAADQELKNKLLQQIDAKYVRENEDLQKKHLDKLHKEFEDAVKKAQEEISKEDASEERYKKQHLKRQEDDIKAATAAEILILQKKRLDGTITEKKYVEDLEKLQVEGDKKKLGLLIEGSDSYLELKEAIGKKEVDIAKKTLAEEQAISKARYDLASTFVSGIKGLLDQDSANRQQFAGVIKALALGEIAINLSKELSAIAAASASNLLNVITFGVAGATQYSIESAIAIARAGFAAATVINTSFAKGGSTSKDGKLSYSNTPAGFVSTPTLFDKVHDRYIAGEAGPEWIAPNWMLQQPKTANIIHMLEGVRTRGYAVGGFSAATASGTTPITPTPSNNNQSLQPQQDVTQKQSDKLDKFLDMEAMKTSALLNTINELNRQLNRGIPATISYTEQQRSNTTVAQIQQNAKF